MNRPFKFRICYTDQNGKKSIIYSDNNRFLIGLNGKVYENYGKDWKNPMWEEVFDSYEPPIIQEHTGLNDKNNNPIYEGDIVRFNPDNPGIATVEFKDYAWVLSESGKAFLPFCYLIKEEVEIIGNLFELPCSKPGAFDHNGECLTCDGWATDCPFINARELNPAN